MKSNKTKKGRPLKMTVKVRKEAAWDALSMYIRIKATKDFPDQFGDIPCYTCSKWHDYKEMDAGHGINSRSNSVLFMIEVIKPQCTYCNRYLGGNYKVFTVKLIEQLGIKRWEELLIESNRTVKMTPDQFLTIQREYEEKLSHLT